MVANIYFYSDTYFAKVIRKYDLYLTKQNILTEDLKTLILNFNQMTACSVINL